MLRAPGYQQAGYANLKAVFLIDISELKEFIFIL